MPVMRKEVMLVSSGYSLCEN